MKNKAAKNRKKVKLSKHKTQNIKHSFTGTQLTQYAGLSPIMKYLERMKLGQQLNEFFPTEMHNATKFSTAQIMLSVVLASFAGVHRLIRIASFTKDALVGKLLNLTCGLNKDVISARLKQLGQRGAILLHEHLLKQTRKSLKEIDLRSITLDVDSTVKTVFGHQEGAQKGYNHKKKGAKSYHPLLAFISECRSVANSWFRTGSAYTSNGICDFVQQTAALLPNMIQHVFFRADSGFFNGALFDLLESLGWTYLVKVKLKNLTKLLEKQDWNPVPGHQGVSICEFDYRANGWQRTRKLKAIRTVTEWVKVDFFGTVRLEPKYEYACYCSDLALNAFDLHERYKERSTSENWIEQVKNQLLAGATLTNDFHANDILWQLSVLAYNLSVLMRYKINRFWHQEHTTFRDWFINLPAKLVKGARYTTMRIYQNYYLKEQWSVFEQSLLAVN